MNDSWQRLREGFSRLTTGQRIQLALAALTTAGLVWGISSYATRVRYGVLFSQLERDDAAAVVSSLRERNVAYRLEAGGTAIEVPIERVDELRLELAGEGLPPGGGVGFEIFDKPSFAVSDFVQNVNYRRALERELGRTIQSLGAVQSARVHLALPPESPFADEKREPSASVVVRLRSGGTLSSGQVRAISQLVASGVEGMRHEMVSVIDGEGRMMSEGGGGDDQALSSGQLDSKRTIERGIESTLVSILEPVVGPGRVRARATVELNMSRVQRVEESWDPNVAVIRSEQKSRSKQGTASNGGIPGTASNLPGGEGGATGGPGNQQETQNSTTNFELNKTVATIAEPVGALTRQSVAVVVDHSMVEATGADGTATRTPTPRSPEEMTKITDLVRAAVGIDAKRGDVLIVENVPFDDQLLQSGEPAGPGWEMWVGIARYAALPIAVLLLALLVVRPGIAAVRAMRPETAGASGGTLTVGELQARLRAGGAIPSASGEAPALKRKLIEAAQEDPRAAALVIKSWLDTSRRS